MKQFYLALKALLQTELTTFKHFNKWNNQIVNIEQEVPFERPALFIEIEPVQWSIVNKRLKKGDISIVFHVVTDSYDTFADDTDGLAALEITDNVIAIIETLQIPKCTPFIHASTQLDNDHGNLIENKITFTSQIEKAIGQGKTYVAVEPDLNLIGSIKP